MEKIEIGYTVEKERWLEAAENLHEFGRIMAQNLRGMNRDGRGQEDADDLMADILLACTAIGYVAEFAVDKCRFIPVQGNESEGGADRAGGAYEHETGMVGEDPGRREGPGD